MIARLKDAAVIVGALALTFIVAEILRTLLSFFAE